MTTYNVSTGQRGAQAKVLVASTADTVAFTDHANKVEIVSDGTSAVYVTVDGTAATVAGSNTDVMPAGVPSVRTLNVYTQPPSVSVISAGTPTYSVTIVV